MGASVGSCFLLSSLCWSLGWPTQPKVRLEDFKFIVHPVNLKGSHWEVINVGLQYDCNQRKIRVRTSMYEPLINNDYYNEIETVWNGIEGDEEREPQEGFRGFVER